MTGRRARGRLFVWFQYVLPQHALSRLVLAATRVRAPWFKNWLIRGFLKLFAVDMSEAVETDPTATAASTSSLPARCKPDARPIAAGADDDRLPGRRPVSECGSIDGDSLLQAKGRHYTLGGAAGRAALGARISKAALRDHLSRAFQLSPRAHAAARAAARDRLRSGPPVQRQCRHGAARAAAVRAQRAGADAVRHGDSGSSRWCWSAHSMWAASPPCGPATSRPRARRVVTALPPPDVVAREGRGTRPLQHGLDRDLAVSKPDRARWHRRACAPGCDGAGWANRLGVARSETGARPRRLRRLRQRAAHAGARARVLRRARRAGSGDARS